MKAIDRRKTLDTTRKFFNNDLDHLCRSAGIRKNDLELPFFPPVVPNERESIYKEIKIVYLTLKSCEVDNRQPSKQILIDRYINGLAIHEVALKIGFSESATKRKVNVALLEFAERIETFKKAYEVTSFPSLLIKDDTRSS